MKKIILIIIAVIMTTGCIILGIVLIKPWKTMNGENSLVDQNNMVNEENVQKDLKSIYLEVLANKREYISEENKISKVEKYYDIINMYNVKTTYAIVDLDQDGTDEMVALFAGDTYLVLNYDENDKKVYGFEIVLRGMLGLKTNGYYMASGGADVGGLCKSNFNKNIRTETPLAEHDGNKYKVRGKATNKSEYDKYVKNEYTSQEEVKWIEYNNNIEI